MRSLRRPTFTTYLGLILYSVFNLIPVFWIVSLSLKSGQDVTASPPKLWFHPTMTNFAALFGGGGSTGFFSSSVDFSSYYLNTLLTAVPAVTIALLLGVPSAFALARLRNDRSRGRFHFFFLSMYFMPPITILVPLYLLYRTLGLYNTYVGQILILQVVVLPLVILSLFGFFRELPKELEDSASVEGCTTWGYFWYVALPLVRPGIASAALLALIFAWQNFIFGYLLADQSAQPVTVGILSFMNYQSVLWGQMAAGIIVAVAPLVAMMLWLQRHLVEGLSLGAVKE